MSRVLVLTLALVVLVAVSVESKRPPRRDGSGKQDTGRGRGPRRNPEIGNRLDTLCARNNLEGNLAALCEFVAENPKPERPEGADGPMRPRNPPSPADRRKMLDFVRLVRTLCDDSNLEGDVAAFCDALPKRRDRRPT